MRHDEAVKLIEEFESIQRQMKTLQARKQVIVALFPLGRTEGDEFDLFIEKRGEKTSFSAVLLRKYVPAATLNLCRVTKFYNGCARIVQKTKRKAKK